MPLSSDDSVEGIWGRDFCVDGGSSAGLEVGGMDGFGALEPNENVRPPARSEKTGCSGTGGTGTPYGFGWFRWFASSCWGASVDDGAVDELLSRVEEALSV